MEKPFSFSRGSGCILVASIHIKKPLIGALPIYQLCQRPLTSQVTRASFPRTFWKAFKQNILGLFLFYFCFFSLHGSRNRMNIVWVPGLGRRADGNLGWAPPKNPRPWSRAGAVGGRGRQSCWAALPKLSLSGTLLVEALPDFHSSGIRVARWRLAFNYSHPHFESASNFSETVHSLEVSPPRPPPKMPKGIFLTNARALVGQS